MLLPVQSQSIAVLLTDGNQKCDLIVHAPRGSGKTTGFAIATMAKLHATHHHGCEALIVSPTRDQARHVQKVFGQLGVPDACVGVYVSGSSDYLNSAEASPFSKVVIGTPGRLLQLVRTCVLRTDTTKLLVLDHADTLLGATTLETIERITESVLRDTQEICQIALFSETVTNEQSLLLERLRINANATSVTRITIPPYLDFVPHFQIVTSSEFSAKLALLLELLSTHNATAKMRSAVVIFCNTQKKCRRVATELIQRGYLVAELHRGIPLECRITVTPAPAHAVFVATDFSIPDTLRETALFSLVVHFDVPTTPYRYFDRITFTVPPTTQMQTTLETVRTISFVCPGRLNDLDVVQRVEEMYGVSVTDFYANPEIDEEPWTTSESMVHADLH